MTGRTPKRRRVNTTRWPGELSAEDRLRIADCRCPRVTGTHIVAACGTGLEKFQQQNGQPEQEKP